MDMLAKTDKLDAMADELGLYGKELAEPNAGSSFAGWRRRVDEAREAAKGVARWHILICEPQMERKAAARLVGNGFKAYLPEALEWTRRGLRRTKVQVSRPLFRGYVFVKLCEGIDPFGWVAGTVGVHKFLRMGDSYAVVPDLLMKRIEAVSEQLMIPTKIRGPSAIFHAGETVRVSEGPFSGLNADIVRLDDEQRITILLTLLGRAVPVTLEAMKLEKL